MPDLVVTPNKRALAGVVPVPSDKSITHRALLCGAIATGETVLADARLGEDHRSTVAILRGLGVTIEEGTETRIHGAGFDGLRAPEAPLDCGNSGTTIRLVSGILAAQPFRSVLVGDASLMKRPMRRVAEPLRLRGARIEGRLGGKPGELTPPLEIGPLLPPNVLGPLAYDIPVASAQVKSALLLSGLFADGQTVLTEPLVSRDHTERMLAALGVPVDRVGSATILDGPRFGGRLPGFSFTPPGDFSSAAFVVAAAFMVEGSRTGARKVGLNPTRLGFLDAVRMMGGEIAAETNHIEMLEPEGVLEARFSPLRAVSLGGETVTRAIDEIPILAALAARAHGTTTIADAAELRVKESDRIAAIVAMLRAFGVGAEARPDGLVIEGVPDRPLAAARVASHGDHRIAMSAAILALAADGPSTITDVDAIATSFPRFAGTLRALGADVAVC